MTKNQSSEKSSIKPKEIPLKEWLDEELKELGIIKKDTDVGALVYFSCIGRFDTRIPKDDVGTILDKKPKSPCNYTLGGLFCFAKTFVISESGEKIPVFEFALDG